MEDSQASNNLPPSTHPPSLAAVDPLTWSAKLDSQGRAAVRAHSAAARAAAAATSAWQPANIRSAASGLRTAAGTAARSNDSTLSASLQAATAAHARSMCGASRGSPWNSLLVKTRP